MSMVEPAASEDVIANWRDVQALEDELLQHVKDVAQRIALRVRNVLGELNDDEALACQDDEAAVPNEHD